MTITSMNYLKTQRKTKTETEHGKLEFGSKKPEH